MSPFLYTALPAKERNEKELQKYFNFHKLDPDRCVQSVINLKNKSVGLSCGFSLGAVRILQTSRETAHDRPTKRYIVKYNFIQLINLIGKSRAYK